jgi:hypothetical protein
MYHVLRIKPNKPAEFVFVKPDANGSLRFIQSMVLSFFIFFCFCAEINYVFVILSVIDSQTTFERIHFFLGRPKANDDQAPQGQAQLRRIHSLPHGE